MLRQISSTNAEEGRTLKTKPTMVVPVFIGFGGVKPFSSRKALLREQNNRISSKGDERFQLKDGNEETAETKEQLKKEFNYDQATNRLHISNEKPPRFASSKSMADMVRLD
jgi:hypothetical protein